MHRDIKPENILLVDDGAGNLGGVTLSDFGFSHQVSPKSRLACGKQVSQLSLTQLSLVFLFGGLLVALCLLIDR